MRIAEIDILRGVAIVMMIIFHFGYDLLFLHIVDVPIKNIYWDTLRISTITLFLLLVGVGIYLAYYNGIYYIKFGKRLLLLFGVAGLISLVTYLAMPDTWIYFGIIHCIALSTLVGILFVRIPKLSLVMGVLIVILFKLGYLQTGGLFTLLQPIFGLPDASLDLVYFFPWFGVVLIGIFVGSQNLFGLKISRNYTTNTLSYMGKHSLMIYLIHQPILIGILLLFRYISAV